MHPRRVEEQEIRAELDDLQRRREMMFVERANIEARSDDEEPDAGLTERIGNLNHGIARLDAQIQEHEADLGRRASRDDTERERILDLYRSGGGELEGPGPRLGSSIGGTRQPRPLIQRPRLDDTPVLTRDQSVVDWGEQRRMFGSQARELSFDRMIRGIVAGNWEGSEAEQRAISESPLTAGGHMVPTPLAAQVIDKARNISRVFQAGALTVPMTSATLKLARLTGEAVPAWRTEGAAITDQAMVFDAVTLTAQSMAMLVKCSIELFEDAPPSDVVENSFAQQIALELDRVALRGTGTPPEPRGIRNQTGVTVTSHGTNGSTIGSPPAAGVMGWEFLVQAAGAARALNFDPNAQIMAPRTDQSLALLRDTTNQYIAAPGYLDGLPRLTTNQVPINLTVGTSTDCTEVYTGRWDQLLIGIRTSFTLKFLGERFIDNGQYAFMAYLRGDVQLAQPTAFVVDLGVRS